MLAARAVRAVVVRAAVPLVRPDAFMVRIAVLRDVVVAPRDIVPRDTDSVPRDFVDDPSGVRETMFCRAAVRVVVAVIGGVLRETLVAVRTAALATVIPIQHAKIKGKNFLILSLNKMLAKKIISGQGLI